MVPLYTRPRIGAALFPMVSCHPGRGVLTLLIVCLALLGGMGRAWAQTFDFARLEGSPVVDTTGWTFVGDAALTNTLGDANQDLDEVMICSATGTFSSGAVYYRQSLNLGACAQFEAEFEYRLFDGGIGPTGADGMTFFFLPEPPRGFILGGGLGVPPRPLGLIVALDPWCNCCSDPASAPKLQIRYGNGRDNYNECPVPAQPTLVVPGLRRNAYRRLRIRYDEGLIRVFFDQDTVPALTGFYQIPFSGFFGFTAATGSRVDNHSIRNFRIRTIRPIRRPDAGPSVRLCSGVGAQIGGLNPATPGLIYRWFPGTGLSDSTIANPTLTLENTQALDRPVNYFLTVDSAGAPGSTCAATSAVTVRVAGTGLSLPAPLESCAGRTLRPNFSGVPGYAYRWLGGPGLRASDTLLPNPRIDLVNNGTSPVTYLYPVIARDTLSGCGAASDTLRIRVAERLAQAGPDLTLCPGDTARIGGPRLPGVRYLWFPTVGLDSVSASNPRVTAVTGPGGAGQDRVYIVSASAQGAICTTTDTVRVRVLPVVTFALGPNAPQPLRLCQGERLVLGDSLGNFRGLRVRWQLPMALREVLADILAIGPDTLSDRLTLVPWPAVFNPVEATVRVQITDTVTGCVRRDSVRVLVGPRPGQGPLLDTALCLGAPLPNLRVEGLLPGLTFRWRSLTPGGPIPSTPEAPVSALTPIGGGVVPGVYAYALVVTSTATGCGDNDTLTVTIHPEPARYLPTDDPAPACRLLTVQPTGPPSGEPLRVTWQVTAPASGQDLDTPTPTLTLEAPGAWPATVQALAIARQTDTTTGCARLDTLTLTALPLPAVSLSVASVVCPGGPIVARATGLTSGLIPQWRVVGGEGTPPLIEGDSLLLTGPRFGGGVQITLSVLDTATGCESRDTAATIMVPAGVRWALALAAPPTLCTGDTITLRLRYPATLVQIDRRWGQALDTLPAGFTLIDSVTLSPGAPGGDPTAWQRVSRYRLDDVAYAGGGLTLRVIDDYGCPLGDTTVSLPAGLRSELAFVSGRLVTCQGFMMATIPLSYEAEVNPTWAPPQEALVWTVEGGTLEPGTATGLRPRVRWNLTPADTQRLTGRLLRTAQSCPAGPLVLTPRPTGVRHRLDLTSFVPAWTEGPEGLRIDRDQPGTLSATLEAGGEDPTLQHTILMEGGNIRPLSTPVPLTPAQLASGVAGLPYAPDNRLVEGPTPLPLPGEWPSSLLLTTFHPQCQSLDSRQYPPAITSLMSAPGDVVEGAFRPYWRGLSNSVAGPPQDRYSHWLLAADASSGRLLTGPVRLVTPPDNGSLTEPDVVPFRLPARGLTRQMAVYILATRTDQPPVLTAEALTPQAGVSVSLPAVIDLEQRPIVPNVITPGGDGLNDRWVIEGIELFPGSRVEVFTRWGRKAFESTDYRGQFPERDTAPGTYYYQISRPGLPPIRGWLEVAPPAR